MEEKGRVGTIGTVGTAESRGCFGDEVAIAIAIGEEVGFEIGIVLQMMSSMIQLRSWGSRSTRQASNDQFLTPSQENPKNPN